MPYRGEEPPLAPRARQPDIRAELRAFSALALDRARTDPDQQPGRHLVDWHRRLAARLETIPRHPENNRELLDGALRLHRIHRGLPDPLRDGLPRRTSGTDRGLAPAVARSAS